MKKLIIIIFVLCIAENLTYADRTYTYVRTVGKDSRLYDFNTINEAIADIMRYNLTSESLGCIEVYDGIYVEQLNEYYPGGHNLPAHCDLLGMGKAPGDVIIQHKRRSESDPNFTNIVSEIYADGVLCDGDNIVENLKIENVLLNQNSIEFRGAGTLKNCIVESYHDAVTASGHLVVSGCTIEGWYRPCIHAYSTFEVSDCTFYPKTRSWGGQHPAGIKATKSGTIDNVMIEADIVSSDYEPHYDTPWLAGVILQLRNPDDTVTISNARINLRLTTLYHDNRPGETADWELFGVVSGGRNPKPTTYYPGRAIVENCQIDLTGIEDRSNPNGDGRAIMVAGVCVQGGGRVDVIGNTSIKTSRTSASYGGDGYEYSLNNQNGILTVDFNTVDFDDTITNGVITAYDPNEFHEPVEPNEPEPEPNEPQEPNIPDSLFKPRNEPPPLLLHCPDDSIKPYRLEEFDYSPIISEEKFEASGFTTLDGPSYVELQEITSSQFLDPNTTYYVPYPPLFIHGVGGEEIDVVIPSNTTIILAEDWDYGIVVYDSANVHFGESAPQPNEPNLIYEPNDANNPILPVWIVGESGSPFFNNFCGIFIDRTAGTRCKMDNIYLRGFYYGIQVDQQLDYPISNIHALGCYNGILSFGANRIMNSSVSYYGIWSPEWQYYGYAYDFIPGSWDGSIIFEGADFEIYNCLADDGDDGFTVYGLYEPNEPPNFYSRDCTATNCYSAFNGWDGNVAFSIICPGMYNNIQNKNFPELTFTDPVNEVNDPFVFDPNDYRIFLDPNSLFVDHGSGFTPFPGWTTSIDGKPDEGIGNIWPHYQTKRADKFPQGDINSDDTVDINDLSVLADEWLTADPVSADLNHDQSVNFLDFSILANYWLLSETSVEIFDPETVQTIDPNNIQGYVGIEINDIRPFGEIVSVYVDNMLLGSIWLGWDDEQQWVGLQSDTFSNGWHTIRLVSVDMYGGIINHKPINVYFNNLLYKVAGSDYFHPDNDYKFSGFYDGSNTLEAEVTNQDGQVIWSNTYSGPHVSITIPGATFGSEQFCALSVTEAGAGSAVTKKDLTKKFKQADYPAGVRMVIILPNKDVFKVRKPAIFECAEACNRRNVTWVSLYHHDVTEQNLTFLFDKSSVRYIYWCGHANSHVGRNERQQIEGVRRTHTKCWRYEKSGWWDIINNWHEIGVFSWTRQGIPGAPPLPDGWDTRGFDLWSLGMHDSWNKKIVFVDGCLSAKYNDMAHAYGVFSLQGQGSLDQIYIGWRIKILVSTGIMEEIIGNTTEGVRMFWERMGSGDDIYDALYYTYVHGSISMQEALWGLNGRPDIGELEGDDNIFLWGNGLINQIELEP
ncbi:MAG: dockerin type I domain-containing protein [Planctomycetota bacterium]|jgi:hypothetical protein